MSSSKKVRDKFVDLEPIRDIYELQMQQKEKEKELQVK
eukprot:CAMPEP_0116901264 /NCGR_PEP_ID=MMETSP0467-20121206/9238_1 /TAXON_ID=283647 /ORGANISM="Mesodinium pulex, Strain SPMC105" /LENGTH=37 /DNA_ID= /DNA_START= /DNA_END= /DNA_ORIENTATION=